MRTIIFADTAFPIIGGGQIHLDNFYEHLRKRGHQASVFTNVTELKQGYGSDYIRVAWPSRNLVGLIKFFSYISKLIKPCDVVYALYSYRLSALVAIACLIYRKPLYIFAHGLGTIIDSEDPSIHRVYRYISLKLASGVIGSSEELSAIAGKFNKNVITLPTGVDVLNVDRNLVKAEINALKAKYRNRKIILTVRRLVPKNGIQYLIETLPYIVEQNEDLKYLIIGDGRLKSVLEDRVKNLGLVNFVEFLGEKPNEEVYKFLALADVVIFPSSAEAMSIACIEAMMVGTPIVATKVGGLVDLLGENNERGVLVDLFGDATSTYEALPIESIPRVRYQDFASKILEALNGVNNHLAEEARKFAREKYAWGNLIDSILDFSYPRLEGRRVKQFYEHYDDEILSKRYASRYPLRSYVHQSRLKCLLSHLELGQRVLEVGCGDGVFAVEAAQKGLAVTATDLSTPNLKRAQELAKASEVEGRVKFIQADAENLPFAEGEFDIVVASHVLEHLPDFKQGLSEIKRVTKSRAIIALPTILNPCSMIIAGGGNWWYWSKRGPWSLLSGFLKTLAGMFTGKDGIGQDFYGKERVPHLWRYPWAMKKKLKGAGFRIISFEADSLPLPFFNFFLPLIKFLDRNRTNPLLRNFGYGSHAVVEKKHITFPNQ